MERIQIKGDWHAEKWEKWLDESIDGKDGSTATGKHLWVNCGMWFC